MSKSTNQDVARSSVSLQRRIIELLGLAAAFGAVFLIVNYIHFHWLVVKVILYACVVDAAIASLIVLGLYWLVLRSRLSLLATEVALVAIASNLLILLYAVMGPTVIDRSLSLYIVEKLDQRGGEIALDAMDDIFVEEYLPEFRLVDVRLTEQVASGTAVIENGCVVLTPQGERLASFVRFYRKTFLPKRRDLLGDITGQLTDPFAGREAVIDARCARP